MAITREEYVKALRSGKYEQTKYVFRYIGDNSPARYCAMGLLTYVFNTSAYELFLSPSKLIHLNDHMGLSFPQIADAIDAGEVTYRKLEG